MRRFLVPPSMNSAFMVGLICFTTASCPSISFFTAAICSGLESSRTVMSTLFPSDPLILYFVPFDTASFVVSLMTLLNWSSDVNVMPPAFSFAPMSTALVAVVAVAAVAIFIVFGANSAAVFSGGGITAGVVGVVTAGLFATGVVDVDGAEVLLQPESTSVPTMALAQRIGMIRFFCMR